MIQELIYKYLNNEASEKEVLEVFHWIEQSEENKTEFIQLKKLWVLSASNSNTKKLNDWNTLKQQIPKKRTRFSPKILKYAASIVLIIACIGYFSKQSFLPEKRIINKKQEHIVLEKSTGELEYISENNTKIIKDSKGNIVAKQNNKELVYYKNPSIKTIQNNTIKVPFSKTFKMVLSDGTIVHLNAGTSLTYPEQFNNTNTRTVSLKGEAYFEVFKDPTKPFIIEAKDIHIKVLGTSFNVSNYTEDNFIACVLNEGSVLLSEKENQKNNIVLEPSDKGTWQKNGKSFTKKQVNPSNYAAWVQGELVFHKDSFANIAKKIERYYNVKIINNYTLLASQEFTGTIKIKESTVENILALFTLDTPFKFSKKDNIIEIYHP